MWLSHGRFSGHDSSNLHGTSVTVWTLWFTVSKSDYTKRTQKFWLVLSSCKAVDIDRSWRETYIFPEKPEFKYKKGPWWILCDRLTTEPTLPFLFHAGSKLSSSSLKALREHYEIPLVGPAHRAMQDVTTLCYVLQRITFDLKLTVPELIDKAFRASDLN